MIVGAAIGPRRSRARAFGIAALLAVAGGLIVASLPSKAAGQGAAPDSAALARAAADSVAAAAAAAAEERRGFHPTYDLKYGVEKDVTNWSHAITANFQAGEKIQITNTAGYKSKDESTLNRKAVQNQVNTSLSYLLSKQSTLGASYSWNKGTDENTLTSLTNETRSNDILIFAKVEEKLTPKLGFLANTNGGTTHSQLRGFDESGTKGDLDLGLTYDPIKAVKTTFNWNGSRSSTETETGSGTDSSRILENRDSNNGINGEIAWTVLSNTGLRMRFNDAAAEYQYPNLENNNLLETRQEERSGFDLSSNIKHSEAIVFDVGMSQSRIGKVYDLDLESEEARLREELETADPDRAMEIERTLSDNASKEARLQRRNNDQNKIDLRTALNYKGWTGGQTNVSLGRDKGYEQFSNDQSQEKTIEHGALSMTHKQEFSKKLTADASGKLDLLSYRFLRLDRKPNGELAVPKNDRDLASRSGEVSGEYAWVRGFVTRFSIGVKQDRTVNIEASKARENNTNESWWLRPVINLKPTRSVTIRHAYELRNDFTFFSEEGRQNFLSKKSQVDTSVGFKLTKKVDVDLVHFYQVRDEGAYDREDDLFARSSERTKQSLDISTSYSIAPGIRMAVGERLEVNRTYDIKAGRPELKPGTAGESERSQFYAEIGVIRDLTRRLNVNVSARQTLTDGTEGTVADVEKSFSRVDAALGYKL